MFKEYSRSFKAKILNFMEILNVSKEESLYFENNEAQNIYFVVSGMFETSKSLLHIKERGKFEIEHINKVLRISSLN